jgi:hypothetical protein
LPDKSPGFAIYEFELRDKRLPLDLPPGVITVQRAFQQKDGSSRGYPAETVQIGPGMAQRIKLPNITEEEAEREWIENSLRPDAVNSRRTFRPTHIPDRS